LALLTTEVLTERATRISPGDPVDITGGAIPDSPAGGITGTVLRVYPAGFKKISSLGVEQQRVKVAIKLNKRPERLGVGFRVYVRIYYDEAVDALVLPRTVLFRGREGQWQVMVVRGGEGRSGVGRAQLQPVTVGLMNDDEAQIIDGLGPDDAVVARPSREIVEGMRVRTKPAELESRLAE
jgi:HlyD family secretion protein